MFARPLGRPASASGVFIKHWQGDQGLTKATRLPTEAWRRAKQPHAQLGQGHCCGEVVRPLVGTGVPAAGASACLEEVKPDLANTPAAARLCVSFDFSCCAWAAVICCLVRRFRGFLSRPLPMIDGARDGKRLTFL